VDTHVGRLATRLGLTWTSKDGKDAVKIERDLMNLFPQKDWTFLGHSLIWHGRRICFARKPIALGASSGYIALGGNVRAAEVPRRALCHG
jgi:endonuclease-3